MDKISKALEIARTVKSRLKTVAISLPLAREAGEQATIHGDILDLLLLADNLEKLLESSIFPVLEPPTTESLQSENINSSQNAISEEIEKVLRKLPRWAVKPQQINSRILKLYLDLESSGEVKITETLLMERYGNHAEFIRNFDQMKMISPKNHGKVFDVQNGVITIWEPVKDAVLDFKRATGRKN